MAKANLRVATRASRLAIAQARSVVDALAQRAIDCEIVTISTRGDRLRDRSLAAIGGDGVFVKELEAALLDGRADAAVHSMKDMPTEIKSDADAGVIPRRGDPRDVLLSARGGVAGIGDLPQAARVGTSSVRRKAQLKAQRPDLVVDELRGNVDTRIKKLLDGEYDAIVLALAGVERLGMLDAAPSAAPLATSEIVPAAGQGALFVQCRAADARTLEFLAPLQHEPTAVAVTLERAFLRRMGGGCVVPIGAHAQPDEGAWHFDAFVAGPDGSNPLRRTHTWTFGSAAEGVRAVEGIADQLLAAGARGLLETFAALRERMRAVDA